MIGSGLVGGIIIWRFQRYLDKKLRAAEAKDAKRRDFLLRKTKLEDRMRHAQGRLFFWIVKAITTGTHNGDLDASMQEYNEIETEQKNLDRERLAEAEIDN